MRGYTTMREDIKDIHLAAFLLTRGVPMVTIYIDQGGWVHMEFEAANLGDLLGEWKARTAEVNVSDFVESLRYLRAERSRLQRGR